MLAAGISATWVTRIWSLTASSNNLASASANLPATAIVNSKLDWVISLLVTVTNNCSVWSITKFSAVIVKLVAEIAAPAVPEAKLNVGRVWTVTVSPACLNSPV